MQTVCWNGIVKNEARVIERCMNSMVGHIDYWVIVDTGSTDGTQDLIRDFMQRHGIDGELIERPWVNFAHNRSEAISLAEGKADYLLLCDADMALQVNVADWKERLTSHAYMVHQQAGPDTLYRNTRLISARSKGDYRIRYWGSTHEYIECIKPFALKTDNLDDIIMLDFADGGSKGDKYDRDEQLLKTQLEELDALSEAGEEEQLAAKESGLWNHRFILYSRSLFYLARTYFDSQRYDEAFEMFQRRASSGGWDEEVWFSKMSMGLCATRLDYPVSTVINLFLEAYEMRPTRAESLYELAKYLREQAQYHQALMFAKAAIEIPLPEDLLFIHSGVYTWMAKDEAAIAAYWTGDYALSIKLCDELLATPHLYSSGIYLRISENRNFALAKQDERMAS